MTRTDGPRTDVQDVTVTAYHPVNGYLTAVTSPSGIITYSGYDANHNVGISYGLKRSCHNYSYDYAGEVKTVSIGSGVTTYAYDPNGNIDSVIMPEGNRVDYAYDSANRLIQITDQMGNYLSYSYDDLGIKRGKKYVIRQGTIKEVP